MQTGLAMLILESGVEMKTLQKQDYWDIALAVFLLIISIVTLVGVSSVRRFDYEPLGPTFLPKALSYCFIVMAILVVAKVFLRRAKEQAAVIQVEESPREEDAPNPHPWLAVLTVGMISVFIASMKSVGFRITSLVFMIALGMILIKFERKSNKRRKMISLIIIAIILSLGLFLVFKEVLGVRVP